MRLKRAASRVDWMGRQKMLGEEEKMGTSRELKARRSFRLCFVLPSSQHVPSLFSLDFNNDGDELPGFSMGANHNIDLSGKCLTDLRQLPVQVCENVEDGSSITLKVLVRPTAWTR